jgi:glucan-binding YG repeat protein
MYWNHVGMAGDNSDGYTASPCTLHGTDGIHIAGTGGCTCNHFVNSNHGGSSTQCMGFAYKLGYDVFGDTTWTVVNNPDATQRANIKVGDIVRINGYHSVFVIGRNGSSVTVGEANYPSNCQINWDRAIDLNTATISYYEHADNYDTVVAGEITTPEETTEATTEEAQVASDFTGWKITADNLNYQYFEKGELQKSQWITIGKKKYYVDKNGYRVTGFQTIKKKDYYFNSKGVMQKKKWLSLEGKDYYVNADGCVLKSQWLYKGNLLVYVKQDGAVAKSELYKIGSQTYYFNAKGKRSKGFKKVGDKYYYSSSNGVILKKQWITVGKKKYYLQKSGVRAQNVLLKIGKVRYYFNDKGCLVKNKEVTYKGKIYKADKNGYCKYIGDVSEEDTDMEE